MDESDEDWLQMKRMSMSESLCCKALALTKADEAPADLAKWFKIHLQRWTDPELKVLKEWKDLSLLKQEVAEAFGQLWENRRRLASRSTHDLERCACCGGPISLGMFGAHGCLACSAPVVAAIGRLIRATTDRYTPEDLYKQWCVLTHDTNSRPNLWHLEGR